MYVNNEIRSQSSLGLTLINYRMQAWEHHKHVGPTVAIREKKERRHCILVRKNEFTAFVASTQRNIKRKKGEKVKTATWHIPNAPFPFLSDTVLKWQHVSDEATSNIIPHEYQSVNQSLVQFQHSRATEDSVYSDRKTGWAYIYMLQPREKI